MAWEVLYFQQVLYTAWEVLYFQTSFIYGVTQYGFLSTFFWGIVDESLERLYVPLTFWSDLIRWYKSINIKSEVIDVLDIWFGLRKRMEGYLLMK